MTKQLLIMLIAIGAIAVVWGGYSVYSSVNNVQPINVSAQYLETVDPTLDTKIINKLVENAGRIAVSNSDLGIDQ